MKKFQARVTEGQGVVVEAWEDGAFLPEDGSPVIGEFETREAAQAAADEAAEAARKFQEGDGPAAVEVDDVGPLDLITVDPYRRDTHTPAAIQLWLDPSERLARLETYSPGQGSPAKEWHRVQLTTDVDSEGGTVDGPATVEWLRSDEGQTLLVRVCDGHGVEWDGHNHVGVMDDDAAEAWEELAREMQDAPAMDGGLWDAGDWLTDDAGVTADTTDAGLESLATALREEAARENIVLDGLEAHLERVRDRLIEERDAEEEDKEEDERSIRVRVDMENNADEWWAALDEAFPAIAEALRDQDEARLTPDEWTAVQALPGFADGPEHAKTALVVAEEAQNG